MALGGKGSFVSHVLVRAEEEKEEQKRGNKDITLTISGIGKLGHSERGSRSDTILCTYLLDVSQTHSISI